MSLTASSVPLLPKPHILSVTLRTSNVGRTIVSVLRVLQAFSEIISVGTGLGPDLIPLGMDPQFRIDGVNDGVLLAAEWASNCVFRLFE
jgi:hypothetical protein